MMSLKGENPNTVDAEVEGERILIGAVKFGKKTKEMGEGWFYMDEMGDEIVKTESPRDVRRRVRERTWEMVDKALGSGAGVEGKGA